MLHQHLNLFLAFAHLIEWYTSTNNTHHITLSHLFHFKNNLIPYSILFNISHCCCCRCRCKTCWLRKYECFCDVLAERKAHYESTNAIKNVDVSLLCYKSTLIIILRCLLTLYLLSVIILLLSLILTKLTFLICALLSFHSTSSSSDKIYCFTVSIFL